MERIERLLDGIDMACRCAMVKRAEADLPSRLAHQIAQLRALL